MKRSIVIIFGLLLFAQCLFAQNIRFPDQGSIEYEKRVHLYAIMKRQLKDSRGNFADDLLDGLKKSDKRFSIAKSTLSFGGNKSLFTPAPEKTEGNDDGFFGGQASSQNNIIYTDFSSGISTSQKKVYDEVFLVKDSTRKITWKITDETREIAGYNCRRANALVLDSIYVVAFYTDRIPVSGGPESFSGLPGMILGVALPHENITWFATRVTDAPVAAGTIVPPVKGKPMDQVGFKAFLNSALKGWGSYGSTALKDFLL